MTTAIDVARMHQQHPDWSVSDLALALGCNTGVVRASQRQLKLDILEPRGGIPPIAPTVRAELPTLSPRAKPVFKKVRYAGAD